MVYSENILLLSFKCFSGITVFMASFPLCTALQPCLCSGWYSCGLDSLKVAGIVPVSQIKISVKGYPLWEQSADYVAILQKQLEIVLWIRKGRFSAFYFNFPVKTMPIIILTVTG